MERPARAAYGAGPTTLRSSLYLVSPRIVFAVILVCLVALGGCGGGGSDGGEDPVSRVPEEGGLREQVRAASSPRASDFPAAAGRSLQQVADSIGGSDAELGLASSVFTVGRNRLAFGVISKDGQFVYGPSVVYVAPTPDAPARGPYAAPADVLITEGRYRSKQAATEQDPFAAVYAAQVPFNKSGTWSVLAVTSFQGRQVATASQVKVVTPAQDRVPAVGERAPEVQTDTLADAKGDLESIDTRMPPQPGMHKKSFDEVLDTKPIALLFATPQLCQSRVCGPVVDIAAQMRAKYGDRVEFIHQEVYVDNDPNKGLREPLSRFNLETEPWLFVVDRHGTITARLEGSFGLNAFESALRSAQ